MRNKKTLFTVIVGLLLCVSCSETDYLTYDTSRSGIYFTRDTLTYSFGVTPDEQRTYTYKYWVRIMAGTSSEPRTFGYEVIADSTTAVEGVQYKLGEAVVPADSIDGYISVTLLRDGLEGSYADGYKHYKLGLRLTDGGDFTPVLGTADQQRVLTFDNAVEIPWKNAKGEPWWNTETYGKWHPLKLIKMVEYYHHIANIQPETYKKMVELYGENLEDVEYGDMWVYRTISEKYILYPCYEYFSDPNNRESIVERYPNFPFDFPNPYE